MRLLWKLIHRKECWRLTWPGRVLALVLAVVLLRLSAPVVYHFLACDPNQLPSSAEAWTVESWLGDAELAQIAPAASTGGVQRIYCTGGPVEYGAMLVEFKSYAEATRVRMLMAGAPSNIVMAVPAPQVRKDRTLNSALALRDWLVRSSTPPPQRLTLITGSVHARRSRMMFRYAFREHPDMAVDVVSLTPERFNAQDWWTCSEGFKTVMYELLAVPYAWLEIHFFPAREATPDLKGHARPPHPRVGWPARESIQGLDEISGGHGAGLCHSVS